MILILFGLAFSGYAISIAVCLAPFMDTDYWDGDE